MERDAARAGAEPTEVSSSSVLLALLLALAGCAIVLGAAGVPRRDAVASLATHVRSRGLSGSRRRRNVPTPPVGIRYRE